MPVAVYLHTALLPFHGSHCVWGPQRKELAFSASSVPGMMLSSYSFEKSQKVGILIMPAWQLGKSRLAVFSYLPMGEWWGQGLNPGPGAPRPTLMSAEPCGPKFKPKLTPPPWHSAPSPTHPF